MDALQDAREAFARISRADGPYWVKDAVNRLREKLAKAKTDASALDPNGKKTAAEMEQEIAARASAAVLAHVRKTYDQLMTGPRTYDLSVLDSFSRSISESLAYLGQDLSVLEPGKQMSAAEVGEKMAAATKRHCLNAAREKYNEYVTSNLAGWADLTAHIEGQIQKHLDAAGAKLEDVDPSGASTKIELEARMAETRRRLHLLEAREKFKDYETSAGAVYADHPQTLEENIRKHLAQAERTLEALDPSGKTGAAVIEERFRKAASRVRLNGAVEHVQYLLATPEKEQGDGTFQYGVKRARDFLTAAGRDAVTADRSGKEIRYAEVERQLEEIHYHPLLARLCRELADFEKERPESLEALRAGAERLRQAFNQPAMRQQLENRDGPGGTDKALQRIEKAARQAFDQYCVSHGRLPLMKPIKFGLKAAG